MMKRKIIGSMAAALTLTSMSMFSHPVHAENLSQLQTQGKAIQKDGKDFQLKGVNAGNVFTTENWMGGLSDYKGAKDYRNLFDKIQDEGHTPEQTHQILDKFAHNRWTDDDFQKVKDMGGNTVRLPINYINLTNYQKGMNPKDVSIRKDGFKEMDNFIQKANNQGLYVIIDMHGAPGSQNNEEHSADMSAKGPNGDLWEDENLKGKTKELWWHISNRYKNNPGVAGYDILNEPKGKEHIGGVQKEIAKFYDETIQTIRNNDDKHIVFLEATWDPQNMPNPDQYPAKGKKWDQNNVVYEYHNYPVDNQGLSHEGIRQSFDQKIAGIKKANYNVPTYMGEFNGMSVTGKHVDPSANDFKHIINEMNATQHMSWTLWNYDTQNEGNWSPVHYSGLKVNNENADDFGSKENVKVNDTLYNVLKESSQ